MGLSYYHLDDADVRVAMRALWLEEAVVFEANWSRDACCGKQLTDAGWTAYRAAMPAALEHHDDDWLCAVLNDSSYWQPFLLRSGREVRYDVADAVRKLAVGEFNIAYVRGLATTLQTRGEEACVVYRADAAYQPRGDCSAWEECEFRVAEVLAGHRARYFPPPGARDAFMVPSGPNCHHSIRSVAPGA